MNSKRGTVGAVLDARFAACYDSVDSIASIVDGPFLTPRLSDPSGDQRGHIQEIETG